MYLNEKENSQACHRLDTLSTGMEQGVGASEGIAMGTGSSVGIIIGLLRGGGRARCTHQRTNLCSELPTSQSHLNKSRSE